MSELPKWLEDEIQTAKECGVSDDYVAGIKFAAILLLGRLEKTRANDWQTVKTWACPDCGEDGRESVRAEVLSDE